MSNIEQIEGAILRSFGVPKKYLGVTLETFEGNPDLVKFCSEYNGQGLVLKGDTGCGKTHLAVSILRNLIEADKRPDNRRFQNARFITCPNLLLSARSSFQTGAKETEEEIINFYSSVPFLIIDDLGSEKTTEFAITTLYIIIDRRDSEVMDTIITTNLDLQGIEDKLSARIASRLVGMQNIEINMPDYRKGK